jgi:hypothetical protein
MHILPSVLDAASGLIPLQTRSNEVEYWLSLLLRRRHAYTNSFGYSQASVSFQGSCLTNWEASQFHFCVLHLPGFARASPSYRLFAQLLRYNHMNNFNADSYSSAEQEGKPITKHSKSPEKPKHWIIITGRSDPNSSCRKLAPLPASQMSPSNPPISPFRTPSVPSPNSGHQAIAHPP